MFKNSSRYSYKNLVSLGSIVVIGLVEAAIVAKFADVRAPGHRHRVRSAIVLLLAIRAFCGALAGRVSREQVVIIKVELFG